MTDQRRSATSEIRELALGQVTRIRQARLNALAQSGSRPIKQPSPKAELINTLDAIAKTLDDGNYMLHVRLIQTRGLLEHARLLVQEVGESARVRKAKQG